MRGSYVGEYNTSTGHQVGGTIRVPNPSAVAYLPDGNIAVAHSVVQRDRAGTQVYDNAPDVPGTRCPATIVSVFSPTTHTLVRVMTELTGSERITKMSCRNGRLAISDDGPNRKCMKVYSISGSTAGPLIRTFGRPATFEDDDGRDTFWNLNGGSIDDAGNAYIGTRPFGTASRNQGSVAVSFAADGSFRWTNFGLGYTNAAVAGPAGEPDVVFTSMLKAMRRRPDGACDYIGAMAYPNAATNPLTNIGTGQCPAPMSLARLGGVDFFAIPVSGRLVIFRHLGANRIRPAASVGFQLGGNNPQRYTWSNPGTIDDPSPSDAKFQGRSPQLSAVERFQLAPNGDVWFSDEQTNRVWRIPLAGLNPAGNPVYNWASMRLMAAPSPGTYRPSHNVYLAVGPDAFYLLSGDERYGPYTSGTYNGYTEGACKGLFAFGLDGRHLWSVGLPEYCPSIAAFEGRVAVAGMNTSRFHIYRKSDGLPDRMIRPVTITDSQDFPGGTLAAQRLATGRAIVTSEAIRASGYQLSDYDDSAPSPAYSAAMIPGATVALTRLVTPPANR